MRSQSLILAALIAATPALAQTPAPAPAGPRAPTDVQQFEDWGVRCFAGAAPPCEMYQQAQNKAGRRVLAVAIAYLPRQSRYILQITVPLGVSFARGVKFSTSGYNSQAMPYQRCDTNGCYVVGAIESGALESLGKSNPQGKLIVGSAADGNAIELPLSLRGFEQARIAMEGLAQEKTTAAAPAPGKITTAKSAPALRK